MNNKELVFNTRHQLSAFVAKMKFWAEDIDDSKYIKNGSDDNIYVDIFGWLSDALKDSVPAAIRNFSHPHLDLITRNHKHIEVTLEAFGLRKKHRQMYQMTDDEKKDLIIECDDLLGWSPTYQKISDAVCQYYKIGPYWAHLLIKTIGLLESLDCVVDAEVNNVWIKIELENHKKIKTIRFYLNTIECDFRWGV